MKLRKFLTSVMLTGMLLVGTVASASPASDALAREEAVAAPLVQAILRGDSDFSAFRNVVDPQNVNVADFGKAKGSMKELANAKAFSFAGFSRNGVVDTVVYITPVSNTEAVAFNVLFDTRSGLIVGIGLSKLEATAAK